MNRFISACERYSRILGVALCAAALVAPTAAVAQEAAVTVLRARPIVDPAPHLLPDPAPGATWLTPILSAVVPGSGQLFTRRDHGAIYLVAEALLVTRYLSFRREAHRERARFRDLAFTVARGQFNPTARDTVFEYFEQMEEFIESGPFDLDPGPDFLPPTDERTFNGAMWALARQTFFTNPDSIPLRDSEEYARAVAFYQRRAVGPAFQWSWRNAGLEQDLFRRSIRQSDEAFRRTTQQLGLLLVNHLLSAVDAFVSYRLEHNGRPLRIRSSLWHAGPGRGAVEAAVVLEVVF